MFASSNKRWPPFDVRQPASPFEPSLAVHSHERLEPAGPLPLVTFITGGKRIAATGKTSCAASPRKQNPLFLTRMVHSVVLLWPTPGKRRWDCSIIEDLRPKLSARVVSGTCATIIRAVQECSLIFRQFLAGLRNRAFALPRNLGHCVTCHATG